MAQKIYVDLQFRADTDQAKKSIEKLQTTLNKAISNPMNRSDFGLTPQLEKARQSAMQLKVALDSATNVDTGRLNLNKFSNSLRSAGLSVKQLAVDMRSLGPDGVKAFQQMASAVASAETKIFSLQGGMRRLVNTFANTLRYQASARAIQGMSSAITGTISYVKELDKNLTNIAIVSKMSADQMERLAKSANKSAKALSVSINQYLKASHIYFQQGLDTAEAMKRANTTIKLANATGESMEEVSNWMTAIWNNFDDGTKSLEYYGDVLAQLGAQTASSADEIANGLEKFAAVAETVGLSYEYAAAALATVTAETRQSAEVVGTAFKTIFARMEGLKLGDTLDDGTTLNQYSLALEAVGVNIKNANGELKDMDTIIDETAIKWQTLSKDQQVALAQSVAGVRQYSQFIALMDNYDIMQSNIDNARKSSGELQKMQEIYAQSIEGLKEKAKTSGEALKDALLDEDTLKGFYKGLGGITDFATKLTKSFGGLKGILLMASSALMRMYQPQLTNFFVNLGNSARDAMVSIGNGVRQPINTFRESRGKEEKPLFQTSAEKTRNAFLEESKRLAQTGTGDDKVSTINEQIYKLKMQQYAVEGKITKEQQQLLEWNIQNLEATRDQIAEEEKKLAVLKKQADISIQELDFTVKPKNVEENKKIISDTVNTFDKVTQFGSHMIEIKPEAKEAAVQSMLEQINKARTAVEELGLNVKDMGFEEAILELTQFSQSAEGDFDKVIVKIQTLKDSLSNAIPIDQYTINTSLLAEQGDTLGVAKGSATIASETAATMVSGSSQEVKQQNMEIIAEKVNAAKKSMDALGIDHPKINESFNQVQEKIDQFTKEGKLDIEEFIKVLQQFEFAIHKVSDAQVDKIAGETIERAIIGEERFKNLGDTEKAADDVLQVNEEDDIDQQAKQIGQKSEGLVSETSTVDDKTKEQIKYDQESLKNAQAKRKALMQEREEIKKSNKTEQEKIKLLDENQDRLNSNKKVMKMYIDGIKNAASNTKKAIKTEKDGVKTSKEYSAVQKQKGENIKQATQDLIQAGEAEVKLQHQTEQAGKAGKQAAERIIEFSASGKRIAEGFVSGMQGVTSVISGLNMLTNSFAQLFTSIRSGNFSFSDFLANMVTLLPALMQIIGPMSKLAVTIEKTTLGLKKNVAAWAAEVIASNAAAKADERNSKKKIGNAIKVGLANIAQWMTKGPWGWIVAAIGAAALATIGVTVAVKKSNAEQEEAELEESKEVASKTNEVSKSLSGMGEKIDTFKNLREDGKSTIEVLKEMSQIVEDLEVQLTNMGKEGLDVSGIADSVAEVKQAYKDLEQDGDIEKFEKTYTEASRKIAKENAARNLDNWDTVMDSWDGSDEADKKVEEAAVTYGESVGQAIENDEEWLKEAESIFLSQDYETVDEAKKAWAQAVSDVVTGGKRSVPQDAIDTIYTYAPTSVLNKVRRLQLFEPNGAMDVKYGGNEEILDFAKDWIGDNDIKASYASEIDFTQDEEAVNRQYKALLNKTRVAQVTQKAINEGFDENVFNSYSDSLAEVNTFLTSTNALTKEIALNNLKLNKGLKGLAESWEEASTSIFKYSKGTIEYAEGIASIQNTIKESMGFEVSSKFVEENAENIQEIFKGNEEALKDFQANLSYDLALGLDLDTETTSGLVQLVNQLSEQQDLKVGTSAQIENIGYLNSLLEDEIVNYEDLNNIVQASGFTIEYNQEKLAQGIYEINKVVKSSFIDVAKYAEDFEKTLRKIKIENRFHEINEELEDLERNLNKVATAKDRAFGNTKIRLLEKEIDAQKESLAAEEAKLALAKEYLIDDAKNLHGAFKIGENGRITNWNEALEKIYQEYGEGEEFDRAKQTADQYEKSRKELLETEEEIINIKNELFDKKLEKVNIQVELDISLAEDDLALLEFQIESLGDSWDKATERFGHYLSQTKTEEQKISTYREGIRGILGASVEGLTDEQILNPETFMSLLGNEQLTSQQIDQLREYRDGLLESTIAMLEMKDTIREEMISCFEDWNSEIDKQSETFDRVSDSIQGYRDIIDLVGKDVLGVSDELMNQMDDANIKNAQNALAASKDALDTNLKSLESAKEKLIEAQEKGDTTAEDFWQKTVDELEESVVDRQESYMSNWKNALQAAADALQNAVNQIMESFEKAMTSMGRSFDELSQKYDQQSEIRERYLEDYEKIYNLSKMTRDIQNSLNDVDNIKSKQKLLELQEEIYNLQESGAQMTQYEVNELRARYELRLAEIALEEAQNAKSNVQMKRDSEGNWSYVYTADQDNVAKAQQSVEDKLYNLQKVVSDRRKTIEDELISLPEEFADSVRQIAEDTTLDEEERNRRLEENAQYYTDKHKWITEQLGISLEDAKRLYNADWQTYSDTIGYKISKNGEWITSFDETIASELLGYNDLTTAHNDFEINTNIMMANLTTAYETYKINVADAMEAAKTSISGFATVVGEDIGELKIKSDKAAESIEDIGKEGATAFETLVNEADKWLDTYSSKMEEYVSWNTVWAGAVNDIIEYYGNLDDVKFPELKSELESILDYMRQIAGSEYSYLLNDNYSGVSMKTYSGAGVAKMANEMDLYDMSNYDLGENGLLKSDLLGENKFQRHEFKNMTVTDLMNYGIQKNGRTHFFSDADISALLEKGWITTLEKGSGESKNEYYIKPGQKAYASYHAWNKNSLGSPPQLIYPLLQDGTQLQTGNYTLSPYQDFGNPEDKYNHAEYYIKKVVKINDQLCYQIADSNGKEVEGKTYFKNASGQEVPLYWPIDNFLIREDEWEEAASGFDTGGYTGSWGPEGRLAMLHQKEIVLNADDTANFLSAINIVRDIASMIDLRAAAQQSALSMMAASTVQPMTQTLQQEVTIHAEFPNASERSEIEAAFDSLLNRASQFANRKN